MLAWGKIDNLQIILFSRDLSYYCPIKKIAPKITDLLPRRTLNSFISNVAVLFQHSFPDGPSVVVVQLLSHIRLYNPMDCSKLVSIELVMLSNHLILCYPPLLLSSIFPSFRVFCNGSALCIRWSKYWSFSFSHQSLQINIQGWFLFGLTGLISLQPKGLSRVFSSTTDQKHQFFGT